MGWRRLLLLLLLGSLFLGSAAALDATVRWGVPPIVETLPATDIGTESAILRGELLFLGVIPSANVSFEFGLSPDTLDLETIPVEFVAPGSFSATLLQLEPDKVHFFRAKAETLGNGTSFGDTLSFTTEGVITVEFVGAFIGASVWLIIMALSLWTRNLFMLLFTALFGITLGLFLIVNFFEILWLGLLVMGVSLPFFYMGLWDPQLAFDSRDRSGRFRQI